eukprot:683-Rhodomonas_salina.1
MTAPHNTCVWCGTRQQSQHEDGQGGVEQVPWRDGLGARPDVAQADCQGRTAEREAQELFLACGGAQHFGDIGGRPDDPSG